MTTPSSSSRSVVAVSPSRRPAAGEAHPVLGLLEVRRDAAVVGSCRQRHPEVGPAAHGHHAPHDPLPVLLVAGRQQRHEVVHLGHALRRSSAG